MSFSSKKMYQNGCFNEINTILQQILSRKWAQKDSFTKKRIIFVHTSKSTTMNNKRLLFSYINISILCFLLGINAKAEDTKQISTFERLTTEQGLTDDTIATLTQLSNGDIAIRHNHSIDVMHGDQITKTPIREDYAMNISVVHWARTSRYDNNNQLWMKQTGRAYCFDLKTNAFVDMSHQDYEDVFVDESHNLWFLKDSTLSTTVNGKPLEVSVRGKQSTLQSVDLDDDKLYAFYNDGDLRCLSVNDSRLLYSKRAYPEEETHNYDASFTIRKGNNHTYYLLKHNYHKCIFLAFNTEQQEWRTIFETIDDIGFHCLAMPSEEIAVVGCSRGIWLIDVATGKIERCPSFTLADGTELNTGVNAVLHGQDGRFLIGTYDSGLLMADSLFAPESHLMQIIIAVLVGVILVGIVLIMRYRLTQKRKEEQLMARIHELMTLNHKQEHEEEEEETKQISELSGRDMEILKQATALVKKNISQQGYNVDDLAHDMAMERTGLYRHLNRIIQQSPSAFIRGIRMERAMELVKEKRMSVTEISEHLGFSSVSYFSKCFKDYYGFTPTECKE